MLPKYDLKITLLFDQNLTTISLQIKLPRAPPTVTDYTLFLFVLEIGVYGDPGTHGQGHGHPLPVWT